MDKAKLTQLRAQVNRLFRGRPEGSVIQLMLDGKEYSHYEIPENHYVTRDSKPPIDWLNEAVCFAELRGIKGNFSLRIKP
jgi:hypothetical protein